MDQHLAPAARRDLDRLLAGGSALGLGDGALLARVASGAGPSAGAALEVLMGRYGPLVARVCGGILGDRQLAEDAAQAVFLVLLRRAGAVRDPDRLAPWLHGVALRTARAARRRHRRRAAEPIPPEDPTMIGTTPDPARAAIARERAEALHAAIARLPGRYRDPVVLCDLDGLTHAEAARRLGCPTATVSARIRRARDRLRAGLARHRVDPDAALPPVTLIAAPRTLAATAAAQLLADRILGAATAAKWKAILAAALVAGAATVGAAGTQADPQVPPAPAGGGMDAPRIAVAPQSPPAAPVSPDRPRRGVLRIAKLRHAGDWDVAPQAIPNLTAAYRKMLTTARPPDLDIRVDYREIAATDANLVHFPLVYIQGRSAFSSGVDDLAALRRHLVAGTLFADAAGGSPAFDASFRRFAADFLPDSKLEPIPAGDFLFTSMISKTSHDLGDVRRTAAAGGAVGPPELEGVKVDGRWAIIYSKLDLGCALAGQVDADCRGYTPESATKIAINIVNYALLPWVPPAGVGIGLPTVREVIDYEEFVGRVAPSRTVEFRSHVAGFVQGSQVTEGDLVAARQPLFEIDRGQTDQDLTGQIDGVKARISDLRKQADKIKDESKGGADPAEVRIRQRMERLHIDLAQLEAQRSRVVAPFAGRVARRLVDVGSAVEAGKTPLATIVAVDPIRVDFEMDERTFLKIRRWLKTRPEAADLPVHVALADEDGFPHAGRVRVQAGQFNPATGTCTLHAELPNPDHALIPGLFARVRVEYGDPHPALLVPEAAISTDQGRQYVSGLGAGEFVTRRMPIVVGPLRDGLREIREGIDARTRVVLGQPAAGEAAPPTTSSPR